MNLNRRSFVQSALALLGLPLLVKPATPKRPFIEPAVTVRQPQFELICTALPGNRFMLYWDHPPGMDVSHYMVSWTQSKWIPADDEWVMNDCGSFGKIHPGCKSFMFSGSLLPAATFSPDEQHVFCGHPQHLYTFYVTTVGQGKDSRLEFSETVAFAPLEMPSVNGLLRARLEPPPANDVTHFPIS